MSHFTVLVIGSDHDHQLAPFHEYECTGRDDEFVQDIDVTDEVREEFATSETEKNFEDWYSDWHGGTVVRQSEVDDKHFEKPKYSYAVVDDEGNLVTSIRRTNPNAKWDWYVVGGRWNGYFLGKKDVSELASAGRPGAFGGEAEVGRFDQLLKKDIDIEGMRAQAAEKAREKWDAVRVKLDGEIVSWRSFKEVRDEHTADGKIDIDKARDVYWAQDGVKHAKEALGPFAYGFDDYLADRDAFVASAQNSVLSTYAVVKDRQWYQKGEMGWFGMSSDEMTQDEWDKKFMELFDSLPDDTMLTVVDCHI